MGWPNNQGGPDPPTQPIPSEQLYSAPLVSPFTAPLPPVPRASPPRRRPRWFLWGFLTTLALLLMLVGVMIHRLNDFGMAISPQAPFSSAMNQDSRTSVLLVGYGGPGHDGPYLTDTMLVVSRNPTTGSTALISVPRDLWVQVPPNSGHYAKINSAFAYGVNASGFAEGGQLATQKVTTVLGIAVPYWISLDFGGFAALVNSVGGVDINVPQTYQASTSPTYSPSVTFQQGMQHMDGATALLFARARYNQPASAAGDFARAYRQQLLLKAIIHRLESPPGWLDLPAVLNALQPAVHTNLSLRDAISFLSAADFTNGVRIPLTDQTVLVDAVSSDGQDILLPAGGDWNAIIQYVQDHLNG